MNEKLEGIEATTKLWCLYWHPVVELRSDRPPIAQDGVTRETYRVGLTKVTTIKVKGEEGNACPQSDLPINLVDERLFLH